MISLREKAIVNHTIRIQSHKSEWKTGETGYGERCRNKQVKPIPIKYVELRRRGMLVAYMIDGGTPMFASPHGNLWRNHKRDMTWDEEVPITRSDIPVELLLMPGETDRGRKPL